MNGRLWRRLERLRLHLSVSDALPMMALLGVLSGLLAGAVIIAFRLWVEGSQEALLPGDGPENYEALPDWARLLLPILGGAVLALLFRQAANGLYMLGIARVLERMAYHQGHLTQRGFVLQFIGAAVAIISGHSVGREGPHVYLGAAAASLLGQRLVLPNNSIRTLVGCGTAAGIAASFNTPLAGVVFALEVVMMEYTIASFIPVIIAASSATLLSIAVFGAEPAFQMPDLPPFDLSEVPFLILLGLAAGTLSAMYVHLLQQVALHSRGLAIWWRMLLAGGLMGLIALWVPQVMGIGYDSVDQMLLGQLGIVMLMVLILAKLVATSICVGLGVPGGMIGPALFLGAGLGSLIAMLIDQSFSSINSPIGFYAVLGMGAVMGASLQAPLAALTAMVELTHTAEIVMPGMLVIVIAVLLVSQVFGKESLFLAMLSSNGMHYDNSPLAQALRRIGVGRVMTRNFVRVDSNISRQLAERILEEQTEWLIIDAQGEPDQLMHVTELGKHLRSLVVDKSQLDLLMMPARRLQLARISIQANLLQAQQLLEQTSVDALYVCEHQQGSAGKLYGLLTQQDVESAYRLRCY